MFGMAGTVAPACGVGVGMTFSLGGITVGDGETLEVYYGANTWPLRVMPPAPAMLTISVSGIRIFFPPRYVIAS